MALTTSAPRCLAARTRVPVRVTPVVYSFFDDLRGWPRRLLAWRPTWRPRLSLGRRLDEALNGRREA